jgi:hypothetical protein
VARYRFTLVNGDEGEIEIPNPESVDRTWIRQADQPDTWVNKATIVKLQEMPPPPTEPTTSEEVALASDQELAKLVGEAPAA